MQTSFISVPFPFTAFPQTDKSQGEMNPSIPKISETFDFTVKDSSKKTSCKVLLSTIVAYVLKPDYVSWTNAVLGEARAVYGLVKSFFQTAITLSRIFAATELSKACSIPLDIYQLFLGIYDFFVEKGEGKVDAFLGILGNISEIGDGISCFASALVEVGALGASTMLWATPLNLASCALSAVYLIMGIRSLYFSSTALKKLNQSLKPDIPNYKSACSVLKSHKYALERHCGVNVQLVQSKVKEIYRAKQNSPTRLTDIEFNERMEKTFEVVKRRIHQKQFSHVLGMLCTKIGIIATILFATSPFFSPLAIGGLVGLAILFGICLFKMGFEYYCNASFKKSIKAIATT